MPIYNKFKFNSNYKVFIWHITENEDKLKSGLDLPISHKNKFSKIKSTKKKKEFLSILQLLLVSKIPLSDLYYNEKGKPFLRTNFISISHSFSFSIIVLSEKKIGTDIEKLRSKILKIKDRFFSKPESKSINISSIDDLTKVWCVKEAVYKASNIENLNFKNEIQIITKNKDFTSAKVKAESSGFSEFFKIDIYKLENYILSIAIEDVN